MAMTKQEAQDYIDNVCDDLKCALTDLNENGNNDGEYGRLFNLINHISIFADTLVTNEQD